MITLWTCTKHISNSNNCDLYCAPCNQTIGTFQSSHNVTGVSSMKQKTLQFVLEWSNRTQEFQVGRQPIPSTGCSNRESPVTDLPTHSWYDQVTVTRRMQRRPWSYVRGGGQQAGNVIGSVPDEHLVHKQAHPVQKVLVIQVLLHRVLCSPWAVEQVQSISWLNGIKGDLNQT